MFETGTCGKNNKWSKSYFINAETFCLNYEAVLVRVISGKPNTIIEGQEKEKLISAINDYENNRDN